MKNLVITKIKDIMNEYLDEFQMQKLSDVLDICLSELFPETESAIQHDYVKIFLAAKRVEGCSEKTARYYDSTIRNVLCAIKKEVAEITTEDLRIYLDNYQRNSGVSRVTIDNIRRILSSFFSWLEDEDYIQKSPVRRIHKVKTGKRNLF